MNVLLNSNIEQLKIGKKVFRLLLVSLVISIFLYGYFVSSSIVNVLVRKEVEQKITDVNSRLGTLETEYLVLKNNITIEYAYSNGFVDVTDKDFAVRSTALGGGLSLGRIE